MENPRHVVTSSDILHDAITLFNLIIIFFIKHAIIVWNLFSLRRSYRCSCRIVPPGVATARRAVPATGTPQVAVVAAVVQATGRQTY